jgi:hypothetical protein
MEISHHILTSVAIFIFHLDYDNYPLSKIFGLCYIIFNWELSSGEIKSLVCVKANVR